MDFAAVHYLWDQQIAGFKTVPILRNACFQKGLVMTKEPVFYISSSCDEGGLWTGNQSILPALVEK